MERSTVIGRLNDGGQRLKGEMGKRGACSLSPSSPVTPLTARGFTLLELMIVMFIMVILVAVALPQYQRSVVHARESVLRDDLYKMRTLIDQYAADKGKLPQSLDDLVSANYMREIPVDPMTNERNWNVIIGEDPNSREGEQGVIDVHSNSTDMPISTGEEGDESKPYNEW